METDQHASGITRVAVGIIRDTSGRVLVNQRQPGKPFAGKWEFPGGKIGPGENAAQALVRELDEELGIKVQQQRPLITFPYTYDDLTVRLCVNEVLNYQGSPQGLEGQALNWAAPSDLRRIDLLEANTAIIRAVILPRLCLITDAERFGTTRTLDRLAKHLESRRALVIVREKSMARSGLETFIEDIRDICRANGSIMCIHADCDIDPEGKVDAIHLPARALPEQSLLENAGLVGISCHTEEELRVAGERGADYALLSPVKPTGSHPDAVPLGWNRFKRMCEEIPMPVYALGGLAFEDQDTAIEHGAQGVAILSAAWL